MTWQNQTVGEQEVPATPGATGQFGPAPAFLRPVSIEENVTSPTLQLLGRAVLNPVLEHALLRAGIDVDQIVPPSSAPPPTCASRSTGCSPPPGAGWRRWR
ncbi:hypothetical protein [Salana multivorans]